MKLPASVDDFSELKHLKGPLQLAIGVFDGVHLGHKAVVESAVVSARRTGGYSGVLTFDPHPSRLFRPDQPTRLIMGIEEKVKMLHSVGIDVVIRKQFDRDYASIRAESFLATLKSALPSLRSIYVGSNFRFGSKRAGDTATLIQSGTEVGVDVFSIERIKHNGEPISSTRIRESIEAGKIGIANDLLGYNYFSNGKVQVGQKLGRTIGFPTLNLLWNPECLPKFGVYLVRFRGGVESGWKWGIANYGVRPTVAKDVSPLLEVHALEATRLNSEDEIFAEWLRFIRPEQKFDSIDELKAQIAKDCETARGLIDDG